MENFPYLETRSFLAFIADNSALGIHRAGFNGVASLVPKSTGNNIFVPTFGGMNFEMTWLDGLIPYPGKFEPRIEPMYIGKADARGVTLVQPETSHAHVSARITFTVEEPYYLHQRIELTFHRRFSPEGRPNAFEGLFASYIHMPPDRHIYLKPDLNAGDDLSWWMGITREAHTSRSWELRPLPGDREIDAASHLTAMQTRSPLPDGEQPDLKGRLWSTGAIPKILDRPLCFYYGFCHDSLICLAMLKPAEHFHLAYSPCGGGMGLVWNPAWDYVLHLKDAKLHTTYVWNVCIAVKPFAGRADILKEVRRYQGM
jgi:hypothetical protein